MFAYTQVLKLKNPCPWPCKERAHMSWCVTAQVGYFNCTSPLLRSRASVHLFLCWSSVFNLFCTWLCLNPACTGHWLASGLFFCLLPWMVFLAVTDPGLFPDHSAASCLYLDLSECCLTGLSDLALALIPTPASADTCLPPALVLPSACIQPVIFAHPKAHQQLLAEDFTGTRATLCSSLPCLTKIPEPDL